MSNPLDFVKSSVEESLRLKAAFFEKNGQQLVTLRDWIEEVRIAKRKTLIFGNGGSAADAQHFAAELMHRVEKVDLGIRAIALHGDSSLLTALANDEGFDSVYARQIEVIADPGDLAIGISTSGNSANIVESLKIARSKGCRTVGLLGRNGGKAREFCDLAVVVEHSSTPRIQEVHGMIIHIVCQMLETLKGA